VSNRGETMSGTVIVLLAVALFLGASGIAALVAAGKPMKSRGDRTGLRIAGVVLLILGAVIGLLAWTIAR
jgi:hypothetical protein